MGGDAPRDTHQSIVESFNPRPRVGGDVLLGGITQQSIVFQSTPPRGGRRHLIVYLAHICRLFQSTPPRGGRRQPRRGQRWMKKFQSTPPRGGRPLGTDDLNLRTHVSIHAPAWGATYTLGGLDIAIMFQSTPPRGGRPISSIRPCRAKRFNPRPRVGGDVIRYHVPNGDDVSIHAPAWGATRICTTSTSIGWSFNPRPRVGGDLILPPSLVIVIRFNPRPRVGGDVTTALDWHSRESFQSTPPRGGRR